MSSSTIAPTRWHDHLTWLTTAADDVGVKLVVAPSVIDVPVPDARELLT